MNLPIGKKIYFASDFHLGIPDKTASRDRERRIGEWLDTIRHDACIIYLVGDLFDVWFEYKHVVPKGHLRFLGKLAELTDAGINIEVFTGNHDLWMKGYFEDELNIKVHYQPIEVTINDKKLLIGHGDGLGPYDKGYKFLKRLMSHSFSQWIYRRIHPDTGIAIADYFSRKGDKHNHRSRNVFLGEDKEWLILFCQEKLKEYHIDYFIFGHRHLPMQYALNAQAQYINLGDWLQYDSYAVFENDKMCLKYFKSTNK